MPKYLIQFVADVSALSPRDTPDHSEHNENFFGSPHLTNKLEQQICVPPQVPLDNSDNPAAEFSNSLSSDYFKRIESQNSKALSAQQGTVRLTESIQTTLRSHALSMGNAACCRPDSENLKCLHSAPLSSSYTGSIQHQPIIQRTFLTSRAVQCTALSSRGQNMCNNHNYQELPPADSHVVVANVMTHNAMTHRSKDTEIYDCFSADVKQSKLTSRRTESLNSPSELSVDVSSLSAQKCSSITAPTKQSTSVSGAAELPAHCLRNMSYLNDDDIDSLSATVSAVSPSFLRQRSDSCTQQYKETSAESMRRQRIRTLSEDLDSGQRKSDEKRLAFQSVSRPPCWNKNRQSTGYTALKRCPGAEDYPKNSAVDNNIVKGLTTDFLDSCTADNSMDSTIEDHMSEPLEETDLPNANDAISGKEVKIDGNAKTDSVALLSTNLKKYVPINTNNPVNKLNILPDPCKTDVRQREKPEKRKESVLNATMETLQQKSLRCKPRKLADELPAGVSAPCTVDKTGLLRRNESPTAMNKEVISEAGALNFPIPSKVRSLSESRIPISKMQRYPLGCRPSSIASADSNWNTKQVTNPRDTISKPTSNTPDNEQHDMPEKLEAKVSTELPQNDTRNPLSTTIVNTNNIFNNVNRNCTDSVKTLGKKGVSLKPASECFVTETCLIQGSIRKRQSYSVQSRSNRCGDARRELNVRVLSNVREGQRSSGCLATNRNCRAKMDKNQSSTCVLPQGESVSSGNRISRKDQSKPPRCLTPSLSDKTASKSSPLVSPPVNLPITGRRSIDSVISAPIHSYVPRTRFGTKLIRRKFYIPESANLEAILADPDDRRIKAICERYKCDVEVYSKLPWCGFLQYIVVLAARDSVSLRRCARTLDYRLNWCLYAQLR